MDKREIEDLRQDCKEYLKDEYFDGKSDWWNDKHKEIVEKMCRFFRHQVEIDPDVKKVIYENLWDLYETEDKDG